MTLVLRHPPVQVWQSVEIAGGSFEVLAKRLDFDGLCREFEANDGHAQRRLETVIVDWRGILDEAGNPVPFSVGALRDVCAADTEVFSKLLTIANLAIFGGAENPRAPAPAPSDAAGGSEATEATPAAE